MTQKTPPILNKTPNISKCDEELIEGEKILRAAQIECVRVNVPSTCPTIKRTGAEQVLWYAPSESGRTPKGRIVNALARRAKPVGCLYSPHYLDAYRSRAAFLREPGNIEPLFGAPQYFAAFVLSDRASLNRVQQGNLVPSHSLGHELRHVNFFLDQVNGISSYYSIRLSTPTLQYDKIIAYRGDSSAEELSANWKVLSRLVHEYRQGKYADMGEHEKEIKRVAKHLLDVAARYEAASDTLLTQLNPINLKQVMQNANASPKALSLKMYEIVEGEGHEVLYSIPTRLFRYLKHTLGATDKTPFQLFIMLLTRIYRFTHEYAELARMVDHDLRSGDYSLQGTFPADIRFIPSDEGYTHPRKRRKPSSHPFTQSPQRTTGLIIPVRYQDRA